jgi:RNA polymerase sigma factor (sigma-70 family)
VSHELALRRLEGDARDAERGRAIAALEPELLALARLLVGQDADARDLVQDTIEAAIRHAGDLRDPSRLRPWVVTIEARLANRARRRFWRHVPLNPEWASSAAGGEENAAVRDALARLPKRIRAAVVLHHMAGLSVGETATAMGVSENTAKSQLKEGLKKLREILS